ncbi:CPBP family intramembrane glutamic endopeptidase [Undibacterium rugosum]|uniref:CPBP family intramembrane metalloprotease n=1 Tax=Undibacterium rugosum TaxID=2762291 RepID=A0A923I1C0_9BURK|nr:CPBP family intramembrane glutamic endopeptidase [Undibacterium rugosum]MBC3935978.1 CPBP family intramembrane metalloprotease [Undibacterium rugosum]MBR7778689.1 CPBP family intramembrane metalloprotease [Undibacterium rugosum]
MNLLYLPYLLLFGAIALSWLPPHPTWRWQPARIVATCSLAAAMSTGLLDWPGLVICLLCWLLIHLSAQAQLAAGWRALSCLGSALLVLGMASHLLPGFHNLQLISAVRYAPDSLPFTLYANFDKGYAGFLLLSYLSPRVTSCAQFLTDARRSLLLSIGAIAAVMTLACILQLIRWDLKWTPDIVIFLAVNLVLTCVAEEAFFRGFLQQKLSQQLPVTYPGAVSIVIIASIFGMLHAGGGWLYVLVATLAGIGYGWIYLRTGRIEMAILTHAALNLTHFVCFSYPKLTT